MDEPAVKEQRPRGRPRSIPIVAETSSPEGQGATIQTPTVSLDGRKNRHTNPKRAPENKRTSLPPSVLSLPIKQREYVKAITDRSADTFGNQVQSAIRAGYGETYSSAATLANRLSNKVTILTAITDMLDNAGLSSKVRTEIISDIAHQRTAEVLHYNAKGKLVQRQVVDNGKLRLQAVREASKLAGDYARAESVARAQRDAVQPLVAHYAHQLRQALKDEDEVARKQALQQGKAGQGEAGHMDDMQDDAVGQEGTPGDGGGGGTPLGAS